MEQNAINSTFRKNLGSTQQEVATNLVVDNNIAKILCSRATSYINGYEALNGELKFNGTVCFSIIYANELGELFSMEGSENFSSKIESPEILTNTVALFQTDVVELKVNSSSDDAKLTATVETFVTALLTESVNTFASTDEDIITNSNFVQYSTLSKSDKTSFNFEENFSCKDSINKILGTSANVKILDYSLGTDYFTVEGLIMVNILYETGEENKELKQFCKCYKFKEELESEGITKEGLMIFRSEVNNCKITTQIEAKDGENVVNFVIPVDISFAYLQTSNHEVVVDAYSLKNKLNLNIESFKVAGNNILKCFDEKIDGMLEIDEDAPRILKIISYCGENASVTNTYKNGDNVVVEGLCSVNVIFMEADDDQERLNSVVVEVPFSLENRFDEIMEGDELSSCVMVKEVDPKCKKGKEINLDLDLMVCVNAFNTSEEMALTDVVVGEPLSPKEACLQIYFARSGNTLWDISKGLVAKPEQILEQNPNINLPLEQDEKIVLFKGTNK